MRVFRGKIRFAFLAAVAFGLGCANGESMPTAPVAPPPNASLVGGLLGTVTNVVQGVTGLLTCSLLRQETRTEYIGSSGGKIQVGPHRLEIPRGALSQTTRITATIVSGGTVGVEFKPDGLQFAKPAKLTLRYDHCSRLPRAPFRAVYIDNNGQIVEYPLSRDYREYEYLDSWINHFSAYAIAY